MNLGQSLKKIRKTRGVRQVVACKSIGITQTYLSQLESNKKNPSIDVLERIGTYYDVPMPVLFWLGLSDEDIPDEKFELFMFIKPLFDELLENVFINKED